MVHVLVFAQDKVLGDTNLGVFQIYERRYPIATRRLQFDGSGMGYVNPGGVFGDGKRNAFNAKLRKSTLAKVNTETNRQFVLRTMQKLIGAVCRFWRLPKRITEL